MAPAGIEPATRWISPSRSTGELQEPGTKPTGFEPALSRETVGRAGRYATASSAAVRRWDGAAKRMTSPPGSRVTTREPAIRRQPYRATLLHHMHSSVVKEHPSRGKCRTPHPRDHAGGALVPPSGTMEGTRCPVASSSPAFSYHPYRRPASGPPASRRFRRGQSLPAHTRRLSPRRTRRCQSGRHAPGKVVATRSRSSRSRVCCSSHQVQGPETKRAASRGYGGRDELTTLSTGRC